MYILTWKKLQNRLLMHIHILITIVLIGMFIFGLIWVKAIHDKPNSETIAYGNNYFAPKASLLRVLLNTRLKTIKLTDWTSVLFIAIQLSFIGNVLLGLIRKSKGKLGA